MSKREEIINQIADFISENGLAEVYAGDVGISDDKKYRWVNFCKARTLDGEVRVYGPKWILVIYKTAFRALPARDSRVFTSVDNAIKFLDLAFVKFDFDGAHEVLTK